jgi:hypothetical protein
MLGKQFFTFVLIAAVCGFVLTACGTGIGNTSLTADALRTSPKDAIAYQFALVKEGNLAKLKECFTERQQINLTPEVVEKGKAQAAKYTLEDLYAEAEMGEFDGKETAKIKMKNGRTLTTLVQTDGKWLADTVWFK